MDESPRQAGYSKAPSFHIDLSRLISGFYILVV